MDEPAKQKALEIAQAVFRVCVLVKRGRLKAELENAAVDLTAGIFAPDASKGEYLAYIEIIHRLERLVALAETAGEIKPVNARVLFRECGNLIAACGDSVSRRALATEEEEDLEDFFSKAGNKSSRAVDGAGNPASNPAIRRLENWPPESSPLSGISMLPIGNGQSGNLPAGGPIAGLTKKSLILDKMRDNGGCRIRDLAAAFPEISERTLRYNLLKLCESGELVKIGGGPAARYLVKNGN